MNNELFDLNNKMISSANSEFYKAQEILLKHVSNKANYRAEQYKAYTNATVTKDFTSQNQRRSYFKECIFFETIFEHSGFTGSYFIRCKFHNCKLNFSIFDNCYFYECEFLNERSEETLSASFCNAVLVKSSFNDFVFHACSLTGFSNLNCHFCDCKFDDVIWENSKFSNCYFENIKLIGTNLEFVYFDNNTFKNTIIPFASIPYAFNLIKFLINTEEGILIDSQLYPEGMTSSKYIELLPNLICFYENTNNFFPLANIFVSLGYVEESFNVIKSGIPFLVKLHEYRTIKYISELMRNNSFSTEQKSAVYKIINSNMYQQVLSKEDYLLNAELYLFEIRNNLLNESTKPKVSFEVYTDISKNSIDNLKEFLSVIETLLGRYSDIEEHYIEYRHNSPYQFLINIISSPEQIAEIIAVVYFALKGINKLYNIYLDNQQKQLNIQKTKLEIEKLKKEDKVSAPSYSKEELEELHKRIEDNSVSVNNIYHNTYNINLEMIYGEVFQHYNE